MQEKLKGNQNRRNNKLVHMPSMDLDGKMGSFRMDLDNSNLDLNDLVFQQKPPSSSVLSQNDESGREEVAPVMDKILSLVSMQEVGLSNSRSRPTRANLRYLTRARLGSKRPPSTSMPLKTRRSEASTIRR
jgi:hypothetical protein